MNILLCTESLDMGGAETHIISLAKELAKKNHSVTLAAKGGRLSKSFMENYKGKYSKIKFYELPLCKSRGAYFILLFFRLKKLLEKNNFQIVHAHSRIHAFVLSELKRIYKLKFRLIFTAHARYRHSAVGLSRWGDRCIAVSEDVANHIAENFYADRNAVKVIKNGVDTEHFSYCPGAESHKIVFVSRLDRDCSKGAYALIKIAPELFHMYNDARIVILGGGECFIDLFAKAKKINEKYGENRIELKENCNDIKCEIADADCAVCVSRCAIESMSCGKNVILFGNEGSLGLLTYENIKKAEFTNFTCRGYLHGKVSDESENKNRFESDAAFLLSEIKKLFSFDERCRKNLCKFSRKIAAEKYSSIKMADETLKVYKSPKSSPKILICGYYGFGNVGDETAIENLVSALKNKMKSCRICILTYKGERTCGIKANFANRKSPKEVINSIRQCDICLYGGGSVLQNVSSFASLLYYCTLPILCRIYNKPYAFLSNGIGPLKGKCAKMMTKSTLKNAKYFSARDTLSLFYAISLSERKDLRLSGDLAFLENRRKICEKSCIVDYLGGEYIAVALNGFEKKINKALKIAVQILCRENNLVPIFIAMDKNADARICEEFAKDCKGMYAIAENRMEVENLIKNAKFCIGERLHFLIFAFAMNLPFVPINLDPKINAFALETQKCGALKIKSDESPFSVAGKIKKYLEKNKTDEKENQRLCREFSERAELSVDDIVSICKRL